jgi:hypothetical protein
MGFVAGTGQIILLVLLAVGVVISGFVLYPTVKNYMSTPGIQNGGKMLKKLFLQKKIKHKK